MIEYDKIGRYEYQIIDDWVNGYKGNEILKLGFEYDEPKTVYRGLRIKQKQYLKKLFTNKPFTLSRTGQQTDAVSWSRSQAISKHFGYASNKSPIAGVEVMGVIVRDELKPQEIILDLTDPDMLDRLMEIGGRISAHIRKEQEIIAKYNPKRKYTFCKNVIAIQVLTQILTKEQKTAIKDRLVNDPDNEWLGYNKPGFGCNKTGKLRFLVKYSSKLV